MLKVENLSKHYGKKSGFISSSRQVVRALDGVSLSIQKGEMLGLVGESGCGKSTFGRTVLRLIPATEGKVFFKAEDILTLPEKQMKRLRRQMQIVFQDPYGSLNPRMTVEDLIGAPLDNYGVSKTERRQRILAALKDVGLREDHLYRFPHEFSGGQCQRIGIARALILEPEFLVCDEPVSALDVSIRAQIVNLIRQLQKERNLTCLFISHDLSIVKHISDRVAVMYLGKIVELAGKTSLYEAPAHPYTNALLKAIPIPDPTRRTEKEVLAGELPEPYNPPSGCHFHPRCPYAGSICKKEAPELTEIRPGHTVACHFPLGRRQHSHNGHKAND